MILVHEVKRVESVKGIEVKRKGERKTEENRSDVVKYPPLCPVGWRRWKTHDTQGDGVRNSRHLQKASF